MDESANLAPIYLFNSDQEFNMKLWETRGSAHWACVAHLSFCFDEI